MPGTQCTYIKIYLSDFEKVLQKILIWNNLTMATQFLAMSKNLIVKFLIVKNELSQPIIVNRKFHHKNDFLFTNKDFNEKLLIRTDSQ